MNLYFRLFWMLIKLFFTSRTKILEPSRLAFRVWPTDCDINFHLTNARYLSLMDLGRTHLIGQAGLIRPILKHRWQPVVHGIEITYIRSLNPLQVFTLNTRLIGWNEKYFYIEHRFTANHQLYAVALVRGLFLKGKTKIAPARLLDLIEGHHPSPPLPNVILEWENLIASKRQL